MPLVGIIVETPALVRVGMPIYTLAEYEINRELNAVSSGACIPLLGGLKRRNQISLSHINC
jgi:hypothetical protein